MNELTDWRGTPITVGSVIIYPGRRGSSQWMNEGVVKEIVQNTDYSARWNPVKLKVERSNSNMWRGEQVGKKMVTVSKVHNVTVIKSNHSWPGLTAI